MSFYVYKLLTINMLNVNKDQLINRVNPNINMFIMARIRNFYKYALQRFRIWPVAHFRENTYSPTSSRNTSICIPAIRAIGYMRCCTQVVI
jgi:hypothetical protein